MPHAVAKCNQYYFRTLLTWIQEVNFLQLRCVMQGYAQMIQWNKIAITVTGWMPLYPILVFAFLMDTFSNLTMLVGHGQNGWKTLSDDQCWHNYLWAAKIKLFAQGSHSNVFHMWAQRLKGDNDPTSISLNSMAPFLLLLQAHPTNDVKSSRGTRTRTSSLQSRRENISYKLLS